MSKPASEGTALLLEGEVDPDEILAEPGIYTAPSNSPAFGVLSGLVALDLAQSLGECMLEDGRRAIAVRVGRARANAAGSITIGAEFFASAKQDYSNWREKWWREAIQNAVDAGATKVRCETVFLDENEKSVASLAEARFVLVSVEDDGGGMNEEILLGKFLVLGGTGKAQREGSVGGFGKAKELLILPWVRWSIETQDIVVEGHGIQYEVSKAKTHKSGTRIMVIMSVDDCTDEPAAIAFIKKCYLPNVRFTVNGKEVKANLKPGELIREMVGVANVYYDKRVRLDSSVMLIRVNGMYMHERWIASGVKGTLIIELLGASTKLLAANRDSIREYTLSRAIDELQNEIASDTKSALKQKKNLVREKYRGSGKFEARSKGIQAEVLFTIGSLEPPKKGELGEDVKKRILDAVSGGDGFAGEESESDAPIELRPPQDALKAMMDIKITGSKQMEVIARQFAWEPDFYVYNEEENFHVPAKFRPEKMPPALRKLARFWGELCRFVLIQLSYDGKYGVGWMFSTDAAAAHLREGEEHWLLLNPFVKSRLGGDVLSLSDKEQVNYLYALAVHEATHMADGLTNHDESFAAALTMNMARTANRGSQIEKIRKAVVARATMAGKGTREIERGDFGGGTKEGPSADVATRMPTQEELDDLLPAAGNAEILTVQEKLAEAVSRNNNNDAKYALRYAEQFMYSSNRPKGKYEDGGGWEIRDGGDYIFIDVGSLTRPTLFWFKPTSTRSGDFKITSCLTTGTF